jgi:hypothetical protein
MAAFAITVAIGVTGGAASASTTALPRALVGCWHRHAPAVPGLSPAGVWLLQIRSGELLAFTPGTTTCRGEADFTATISVAGRHLTIGAVPVCSTKGVYAWKTTAKTLTLKATADKACSPRRLLFTGVWTKR